jgi:hypothetical protein
MDAKKEFGNGWLIFLKFVRNCWFGSLAAKLNCFRLKFLKGVYELLDTIDTSSARPGGGLLASFLISLVNALPFASPY